MPWEIQYYSEAVRRGMEAWPVGIRAMYARITERMEVFGPHLVGMPFTRSMGEGLFELRAKGKEGIGRVFFCTAVGHIILILHPFIKKSQKTPRTDLELARRRLREVRREHPR
jgi:phage-related protein